MEKNLREIAYFIIALVAGGVVTVHYERFGGFKENLREYRSRFGTASGKTFH